MLWLHKPALWLSRSDSNSGQSRSATAKVDRRELDVETWCAQNNLTKANYYYRLRRVREVCLEQVQGTAATAFVELPVPTTASTELPKIPQTVTSDGTAPLIRIKNTKGLSAEIFSGVSPEMLRHLIGAFSHVE